ncbi:MAG: glycosyltransferase family 2 protein [Planctomycetota bacterium]|jgi:cellulose synthase/poly-beta-1,6-N-acetylglucosamine synthase-like glycosyltransferase
MNWYDWIVGAAILSQLGFLALCYRNYRYVLSRYKRKRSWHRLRVVLTVPCKGLDPNFEKNIHSFFNQDYENYLLWFVVGEESDPAYKELGRLKTELSQSSKARDVRVFVAGRGQSCSQKIHNLLYCYERIGDDVDVLAFADSDVCVRSDWLSQLIWPLRKSKNGAASGYRWFVPKKNNPATLALSVVNAKVAQFLGNTHFNQAWGGSMAIRVDVFREVGLDRIWPKALSDDLSLSVSVKKAGKKVVFVPACLVASYESTTWRELFEFGRRQFLITRVSAPRTWWFGLFSSLYSVLGLWAGAGLAVYAGMIGAEKLALYAAVPILFLAGHFIRAILRQRMIARLLEKDRPHMKYAMAADILTSWLWSPLLLFFVLSSAFGRTITWRGIRYKLLGPTETVVLGS